MDTDLKLDSILDRTIHCRCGQIHKVPVKGIFFSEDALMEIPEFLTHHIQDRSAVLISDIRTHDIAGRQAKEILENAGWSIRTIELPDGEKGSPVCDDRTFQDLSAQIPPVQHPLWCSTIPSPRRSEACD